MYHPAFGDIVSTAVFSAKLRHCASSGSALRVGESKDLGDLFGNRGRLTFEPFRSGRRLAATIT